MKQKASVMWTGGIGDGRGALTKDRDVRSDSRYSFAIRFENSAADGRISCWHLT